MKMDSIWGKGVQMPRFEQLEGDLRTDVLVIGGGMAGLLCAHTLKNAGVDCALIEEKRLMSGVSGRTTAKITAQHGLIYSKLLQKYGPEKAWLYWKTNADALSAFRKLAEKTDCDFESKSSYLYATGSTQTLEQELLACEQIGIPAMWKRKLPLPFLVTGGIEFAEQGQFHPLKLAANIAKNLQIYENTKASEINPNGVKTSKGTIKANKIIVATHFPILNKHGAYFLKLYQQRSYVIALENAPPVDGMYLDWVEDGLSIRSAGGYLLLGGGGHRTGKHGLCWSHPEAVAKKYYPQANIVCRWATQDCMPLDHMPYIGQYSRATPNLYVATGFQKWGMSGSMAAAMILSDLVQEKENPYAWLFSPSRSILHGQLLVNSAEAMVNLLRLTKPRCPHLGCTLRWNAVEHSWDCPCHGSRFDADGKVLNNPATDDMKK